PVTVAEEPDGEPPGQPAAQLFRLRAGAVATSSVTVRRWRRGGAALHHIVDPRTGRPADGPWRTATVVAATCADANAASTAAIVAGVAARLGPGGRLRLAAGELHRTLALFSVAFLGLHVATAIMDPFVRIGWTAVVLPLASPYRALAIGLGALAVDLGAAVLV